MNDWRVGNPPFEEFNGGQEDNGESRHSLASLRNCMEHMVNHGERALEQAAARFGLFAMGLAKDREDPDRTRALATWAAGIMAYLKNEDQLEHAQFMARHASPRTTKLYDRRKKEATLDEVGRNIL